jgi:hypothetical protein
MTQYLGDYNEDDTLYFLWNSNDSDGASITRSTDGTISVYKDNGTTQSTAGVTDAEDFDGLTGVHAVTIDLSADAFYATGADYAVVLSAATIDTQTVNAVLAHFSIENRAALRPTVAGRKLDVSAGGEAGLDWANVGTPGSTVSLSATTVGVVSSVTTFAAAAFTKIADVVLRRSLASALASSDGDAKSFRSLAGGIAKMVNKVAISGSTLTVYETDDSTSLGTQAVTTSAAADPITALDTA